MKTIVFHSYKGGLGRSMALANLSLALSDRDRRVVLLDLDVDAPSMHFKFQEQKLLKFRYEAPFGGYIDYLKQYYEPFEEKPKKNMIPAALMSTSVEERAETLSSYALAIRPNLKLIPAGNSEKNIYWTNLMSSWLHNLLSLTREELLRAQALGALAHGAARDILAIEKDVIENLYPEKTDYLLIDCRSAREYSSVALCYWADVMVSMFNASTEGLRGAIQTQQFVLRARGTEAPRIIPVLCRVPESFGLDSKEGLRIKEEFKQQWIKLANGKHLKEPEDLMVLHEYRDLEITERFLINSSEEDKHVSLTHEYLELFSHILKDEKALQDTLSQFDVTLWKTALGMTQDTRLMESYFVRLRSGELINRDKKRNVALRTDTLLQFMNSIRDTQVQNLEETQLPQTKKEEWIENAFARAGFLIGGDFGKELMEPGRVWEQIPDNLGHRLDDWCKFDSECGFGRLTHSYSPETQKGHILWENNFLLGERKTLEPREHKALEPHLREFAKAYVHGVLKELVSDMSNGVKISAQSDEKFDFELRNSGLPA